MSTAPPITDPRFDPEAPSPYEPKKRSPWMACLVGCLAVLLVLLVMAAVVIYWISQNWRGWTAEGAAQVIKVQIGATNLPAPEKAEINAQVDRVATAVREGRLSFEQLGAIFQQIGDSPLMPMLMVSALDRAYLARSGLNAEEQADGRVTIQRFMRGVLDGKIDQPGINAAMVHVADRGPGGDWRLRQRLTDQELRDFLVAAKTEADEAGVAPAPDDFDPSEEFKRIIDAALGEAPAPAPDDSADPRDEPPQGIGEEEESHGSGSA
jgi:hypothetical protein